jgi:hypothetical protein
MTTEKVNNAITKLENINPNDEYAYENAILAYCNIEIIPIILDDISIGNEFFRARTHKTNDFFTTIDEISIAPNQYVDSFARCNRLFQSKFYCSENRPTSYAELVEYWSDTKEIGEKVYVTIGRWKLKKTLTTIVVTTPDPENRISEFDKRYASIMDNLLMNCNVEMREASIIFYRYMFKKFRKSAKNDTKTYIITSAFCNLAFLYSKGQANGICYPSVPFAEQGINIAINPDFITSENIELIDVIRNEMGIYENESKKSSFKETAILQSTIDITNNLIEWK